MRVPANIGCSNLFCNHFILAGSEKIDLYQNYQTCESLILRFLSKPCPGLNLLVLVSVCVGVSEDTEQKHQCYVFLAFLLTLFLLGS